MQEFKLDKNKFRLNYAELLIFQGKIAMIALLLGNLLPRNHWILYWLVSIYILVVILSVYYQIKKQRRDYQSYRLQITENSIVCKQNGYKDVVIDNVTITRIERIENQLSVLNKENSIPIPQQLEQYDEVVELLAQIHPITTRRYSDISELQNN